MAKYLIVLLTGLIFLFFPWYYMDPGQLQPVDAPIFLLLFVFFLMGFPLLGEVAKNTKIFPIFMYFSLYTVISLLVSFILGADDATLRLLMQNIYSTLLVLIFVLLFVYLEKFKGEQLYNLILSFLLIDLIFPFVKWLSQKSIGTREPLTFSNANQLGFFALVNLSVLFYMALLAKEKNITLPKIKTVIILNINMLFLFVATSRACYSAILIYVLSYFVIFRINFSGYAKWLFGVLGLFLAISLLGFVGHKLLVFMQNSRLDVHLQTTTSVMNDFYFRAVQGAEANFSSVWKFLLGSGSYTTAGRKGLEFHNNFVAIFFQVGFIGFLFYLYLNIIIVKELFQKGLFYLVPYICYLYYSIFHYSYRVRVNWLLLAVIIFIVIIDRKRTQAQKYSIQQRIA